MSFQKQINYPNLPTDKPTFVIAVPRYHENLFQIIKDNHTWLSDDGISKKTGKDTIYIKKINTQPEFTKLQEIIKSLRAVGSEIFLDSEYHPKPQQTTISDYLAEFLKTKSIGTHYMFKRYYRITVFPFGFDWTQRIPSEEEDPRKRLEMVEGFDGRQEYLLVPLFIILKRGKTLTQMKSLSYNEDGSFSVNTVKPYHFWRADEEEEEEKEEVEKEEEVELLPTMIEQ